MESKRQEGNEHYKNGEFQKAIDAYTEAIGSSEGVDLAKALGNRAAAKLSLGQAGDALSDCRAALEADPSYVKAAGRAARCHERLGEEAEGEEEAEHHRAEAQRYKRMEGEGGNAVAEQGGGEANNAEATEQQKQEALGALQELGDMILQPFGLSTKDFKAEKDPQTGSYSISMNSNNRSS